jgi:hypothetical protein
VTLDLLRSSASSPGDNQPILFAIASAYDRAFGTEEPAAGWCTVLSVADSGASPYLQFHQARAATLEQFTAGKIDGAARVDLTATLPPDAPKALRAEAFRLAGSTLPVLDVLMKTPDPRIAARASVIEGDLWCRVLNDRARGIPMMRDGLDQSDAGNWPGKDRFTANLALYCILEGKDDEGVRLLHQAQTRFQAAGRWDDLANSLKNEAGYLQLIGKTEQAAAAQKRADEASRRAGHAQL